MIALTVNESKHYQFDPKQVESSVRLSGSQTLLIFDGGRNITVDLPQDILFMAFRGRRELPKHAEFKAGIRIFVKQERGPIFSIAMFPIEKPDLVLRGHFRSKETAIFIL